MTNLEHARDRLFVKEIIDEFEQLLFNIKKEDNTTKEEKALITIGAVSMFSRLLILAGMTTEKEVMDMFLKREINLN